jgi:hypothetical protein
MQVCLGIPITAFYRFNKSVWVEIDELFTTGLPALRRSGLSPAWTGVGQYRQFAP